MASARRREGSSRDDRAKECPPRDDGVAHELNVGPPIARFENATLAGSQLLRTACSCRTVTRRPGWGRIMPILRRCCRSISSPPQHREAVSEVIREHTFHRQGETETFPCHGSLYLSLLDEPLVPLTLWKDLSESQVQLQKVGPERYQGTDGAGATAVWDFVLRTPRLPRPHGVFQLREPAQQCPYRRPDRLDRPFGVRSGQQQGALGPA